MVMVRRFLLLALFGSLAAGISPATAQPGVTILEIYLGTGDSTVYVVRSPHVVLDRGGTVDGLPALREGQRETIPWSAIRSIEFIPGDIPTAMITYRDEREDMVDVEPCRIASAASPSDQPIDIHDIAGIDVR